MPTTDEEQLQRLQRFKRRVDLQPNKILYDMGEGDKVRLFNTEDLEKAIDTLTIAKIVYRPSGNVSTRKILVCEDSKGNLKEFNAYTGREVSTLSLFIKPIN